MHGVAYMQRKAVVLAILRFALIGIKFGLQPIALVHSERLKNCNFISPLFNPSSYPGDARRIES